MTARSRERGSHAGRPRNYGLPFTVPGLPGLGMPGSLRNGRRSSSAAASLGRAVRSAGDSDGAGRPGRSRRGRARGPARCSRPGSMTFRRARRRACRAGQTRLPLRRPAVRRAGDAPRPRARRAVGGTGTASRRRAAAPCSPGRSRLAAALVVVSRRARRGLHERLRRRRVRGVDGAGVPARLAAGQLRAGGGPHQRRHRAGEGAARGRLHRPRRDQRVLRHDERHAARRYRGGHLQGHGGPRPGGAAVVLHRDSSD